MYILGRKEDNKILLKNYTRKGNEVFLKEQYKGENVLREDAKKFTSTVSNEQAFHNAEEYIKNQITEDLKAGFRYVKGQRIVDTPLRSYIDWDMDNPIPFCFSIQQAKPMQDTVSQEDKDKAIKYIDFRGAVLYIAKDKDSRVKIYNENFYDITATVRGIMELFDGIAEKLTSKSLVQVKLISLSNRRYPVTAHSALTNSDATAAHVDKNYALAKSHNIRFKLEVTDILFYSNKSLLNAPYSKRLKGLFKIFDKEYHPKVFKRIPDDLIKKLQINFNVRALGYIDTNSKVSYSTATLHPQHIMHYYELMRTSISLDLISVYIGDDNPVVQGLPVYYKLRKGNKYYIVDNTVFKQDKLKELCDKYGIFYGAAHAHSEVNVTRDLKVKVSFTGINYKKIFDGRIEDIYES